MSNNLKIPTVIISKNCQCVKYLNCRFCVSIVGENGFISSDENECVPPLRFFMRKMEVVSDYVSNFTAHIAAESDMGEAAGATEI